MKLTRRQALGLLAGAGALGGCNKLGAPQSVAIPTAESDPDARFMNRAGFGPRPGELEQLREAGRERWLAEQLSPGGDEPFMLNVRLSRLEINNFKAFELRDWPKTEIIRQSQQADLLRAVMSPWQIRERMADFWTNHFNIYANKGIAAYRIPADQREVVRKHALGSFPEMLKASAHSTAMLFYLDQQASHYGRPNENYARELLELHTLGVEDGEYTQDDVMEVARCFTGWTEERRFLRPKGNFRFDPALHATGEKRVLGHTIPAGREGESGVQDGEDVLKIVSEHPSTGRHLSRKLCKYFMGSDGWQLEEAVADAYLETDGDIRRMLRTILLSDTFLEARPTLKRPFDFVVSALRATDATTDGRDPVLGHLSAMGQPTHMWPMPDGYPIEPEAWSGSMLGRWNFALELSANRISGTDVDLESLTKRYGANDRDEWVSALFGVSASDESLASLRETLAGHTEERPAKKEEWEDITALCLCSPEFQWR